MQGNFDQKLVQHESTRIPPVNHCYLFQTEVARSLCIVKSFEENAHEHVAFSEIIHLPTCFFTGVPKTVQQQEIYLPVFNWENIWRVTEEIF